MANHEVFEIGDCVVLMVDHPDGNDSLVIGDVGYVCDFDGRWEEYDGDCKRPGIAFDKVIEHGHTCSENCEDGHGWYVNDYEITHFVMREINDHDVPEFSDLIAMLST